MSQIKFYGTRWCGDCHRSIRLLDENGVSYEWIDIDESPEAAGLVKKLNQGMTSVPTILFPDGTHLVEPTNSELSSKLVASGFITSST